MKEGMIAVLAAVILAAVGGGLIVARVLSEGEPVVAPGLTLLPAADREALGLALLLPVGVLAVIVTRNVIGAATLGLVTPAFLAVALAWADPWTSAVCLGGGAVLGLGGRGLARRVRMTLGPRLGLVVTAFALVSVWLVAALRTWGVCVSPGPALLALVVVAAVLERFSACASQDGIASASRALAGTLAVGLVCGVLFARTGLRPFVVRFPESLFFVAAAFVLLGRYIGFRLTELVRFRSFARNARRSRRP